MTLNQRQNNFAREYSVSGNGTQSAINAGYSERTAYSQANRLLKNDEVKKKITEYEEEARVALQQQFSRDAIEARKIMFNIMQDGKAPANVRLAAARDFMDRAGFKPVEKSEVEMTAEVDIDKESEMLEKYLKDVDSDD